MHNSQWQHDRVGPKRDEWTNEDPRSVTTSKRRNSGFNHVVRLPSLFIAARVRNGESDGGGAKLAPCVRCTHDRVQNPLYILGRHVLLCRGVPILCYVPYLLYREIEIES